jgi:ketosteroid isomerase-like protein
MIRFSLIFLFSLSVSISVNGQSPIISLNEDSVAVSHQLQGFVESFENLDFDRFQTFFSPDVTVFFPPSAQVNDRVDGKKNVMKVFQDFFSRVRKEKSGAPYLDISPRKLRITFIEHVAIVTFELDETHATSRRTIILRKENGVFLIYHMHASKIENPD